MAKTDSAEYTLEVMSPGVTALVGIIESLEKGMITFAYKVPRSSKWIRRPIALDSVLYMYGKVGEEGAMIGFKSEAESYLTETVTDVKPYSDGLMQGTTPAGDLIIWRSANGMMESEKMDNPFEGKNKSAKKGKAEKEEAPTKKTKKKGKDTKPKGKGDW